MDLFLSDLSESKSTKVKTQSDIRKFKNFLNSENEDKEIEDIPDPELDILMSKFFVSMKTRDGTDYDPRTLKGFQASIQRYLHSKGRNINVVSGESFIISQKTLKAKQKALIKSGKTNSISRTFRPISEEQENALWECGQLGTDNPDSLINTLWFMNSLHFGMRARADHRNVCWGDVQLKQDEDGMEYLQFSDCRTKRKINESSQDNNLIDSKVFKNEANPNRCPIRIYKCFAEKRPNDYCNAGDPFYLSINHGRNSELNWFTKAPIGVNRLGKIWQNMTKKNVTESGEMHEQMIDHSVRNLRNSCLVNKEFETQLGPDLGGWNDFNLSESYAITYSKQQHLISSLFQAEESSPINEGITSRNDFREKFITEPEICVIETEKSPVKVEDLRMNLEGKFSKIGTLDSNI